MTSRVLIVGSKCSFYGNSDFSTPFTRGGWCFIHHGWLTYLATVAVVTECSPKEVEKRVIVIVVECFGVGM